MSFLFSFYFFFLFPLTASSGWVVLKEKKRERPIAGPPGLAMGQMKNHPVLSRSINLISGAKILVRYRYDALSRYSIRTWWLMVDAIRSGANRKYKKKKAEGAPTRGTYHVLRDSGFPRHHFSPAWQAWQAWVWCWGCDSGGKPGRGNAGEL